MKRMLLSMVMVLSLGLVGTAGAYTITFDTPLTPGVYSGHMEDGLNPLPFQTVPLSNPFTTAIGPGNTTQAVFTTLEGLGNPTANLVTYLLDANNNFLPAQGQFAEFFFHGVDLYASGNTTVNVVGLEGFGEGQEVFRTQLTFTSNGTFQHFDFDSDPMFKDLIALDGVTLISRAGIGALEFSVDQKGPAITYGFDSINVCRQSDTNCTFNLPLTYQAPSGGGPYNTPEPASLLLLGAGLAGIGIWRRKARG